MQLVSIQATDFLSFKTLDVSFDSKGLVLVKGWNFDEASANGVGKSAMFDAILWALFGKTPRDLRVDEYIRRGCKSAAAVVTWRSGDVTYRVERHRNPNTIRLYEGETELFGRDGRDVQDVIVQKLGFDYETFQAVSVIPQYGVGKFLLSSDEYRRELLLNILNVDVFDKAHELCHSNIVKTEASINSVEQSLTFSGKALISEEANLKSYQEGAAQFETKKAENVASFLKEIADVEIEIEKQAKQVAETDIDGGTVVAKQTAYNEALERVNRVKEVRKLQAEKHTKTVRLETELKNAYGLLQKMQSGVCPTCGGTVKSGMADQQAETVKKLIGQHEEAKQQLAEVEQALTAQTEDIELQLAQAKSDLDMVILKQKDHQRCKDALFQWQKRKGILEQNKKTAEEAESDFSEFIDKSECKIKELKEAISRAETERETAKHNKKVLEGAKYLLGPHGVRSAILDRTVGYINYMANSSLQTLFGGSLMVNFEIVQTGSKQIKQSLKAEIIKSGVAVPFMSLSGGERKRVMVAVDLALSDLVAKRRGESSSILFLDEISEGLDADGRGKLFDLLKKMSSRRLIYVIDHAVDFMAMFDTILEIEKKQGVSSVGQ